MNLMDILFLLPRHLAACILRSFTARCIWIATASVWHILESTALLARLPLLRMHSRRTGIHLRWWRRKSSLCLKFHTEKQECQFVSITSKRMDKATPKTVNFYTSTHEIRISTHGEILCWPRVWTHRCSRRWLWHRLLISCLLRALWRTRYTACRLEPL